MFPLTRLSGHGHYLKFIELLENEIYPIKDYQKKNLVAIAADGASTMASTFRRIMTQWAGRNIPHVWCLAHKMDLGLKHAQKNIEEFAMAKRTVNDLHNHHMNAPKKYNSLQERKRKEGIRVRRLPQIKKVRWVPAQLGGYSTVLEMWQAIVRELESEMETATGHDLVTATDLYNTMTTLNFVSSLAFLQDATAQMSETLGTLQRRGTLIISNTNKRNVLLFNARHLQRTNGPTLSAVLQESTCDEVEGCTLQEFETRRVAFRGFRLSQSPNETLVDLRHPFLTRLIEQINNYFPLDIFEKYFIFNPRVLKAAKLGFQVADDDDVLQQQMDTGFIDVRDVQTFAGRAISHFAYDFNKLTEAPFLASKSDELVPSILDDPNFLDLRNSEPEIFWSNALNKPLYKWSELTTRLVKIILTIGATSVEPESGFSVAS